MNGEVNGTMEEIIEIPLSNSEEPEEIVQIPLSSSENPEEIGEIPLAISKDAERIVQILHATSEEPQEIIETARVNYEEPEQTIESPILNFEKPEEIIEIPLVTTEEIIEIPLANSEEPEVTVDICLANSEDSKQSIETDNLINEDHVIEIVTRKNINDTDNDSSQEAMINSTTEHSESNNSSDSIGSRPKVTTIKIFDLVRDAEFSSNDVENRCNNSNGSFAESMGSSQTKSETTSQQPLDCLNENSNNFLKIENCSQHSEDEGDLDELTDVDVSEEELKATDTVSINSDTEPENDILISGNDELSQESQPKAKNTTDIILVTSVPIEGPNGDSQEGPSPEIHEIESENEDCTEIKEGKPQTPEDPVPLRRSSRAIKRKRYTDDIENGDDYGAGIDDPLRHKSRTIVVNNTKVLVEMAAKNMKFNQGSKQKKEPTVVIIDTNSERHSSNKGYSMHSTQNTHNMFMHRNTNTMSNKSNTVTHNSSQTTSILPSLTDDMFVVEAPSFIVPYVYEKPSMKPFREFVDNLGKELDEQKAKEKELLEKLKGSGSTDKQDKDTNEKIEESGDEEESNKKKKREAKKEQRRLKNDDDASWDGESSTESEDDILSDEEDKISIIKDKGYLFDEINNGTDLTTSKVTSSKSDNYFDCSLGKFFMGIGYNLVQEYVQNDLLKQQNRKLYRAKKSGHSTRTTETSIASLKKNLELSKENNAPYAFKTKKCEFCSFKTESALILAHHLETPHVKNNIYKCNFCSYEIRSPHDILIHTETVHNSSGKLEKAPTYHQCANCTFEDNGKGKLARHLISCTKKFKPDLNLAPPIDWEPPAKIPKISKSRNNMVSSYQNTFNRGQIGNSMNRPMNIGNIVPGVSSAYRPRGRSPMPIPPRPMPVHGLPIARSGLLVRHNPPIANSSNYPVKQKSMHQPSISITPLPRQPQPVQSQSSNTKSSFVICEICDGYIKDLEQLRNHMQSIHKVKIHPKMIYNRPPLNCQKCQFRFFTDQGLERHLLGSHGLVTSSMQEAANKGKDAGRCPVCGRVYQWKLLNHVARDHNLTLKPAHLSYKCTVCTATFGMYKQFENHVYSAHSVVAKRVMDKSKTIPSQNKSLANNSSSLLKPLKINDEITIIPQPIKSIGSKDK